MRCWIIAYLLDGEIVFYRTGSIKYLLKKTEELKGKGILYNTLSAKGYNMSFR